MKVITIILLCCVLAAPLAAQPAVRAGAISGRVFDAQTGDILIGANIAIPGTKFGASTDIEGRFLIRNLPAGVYALRASMLGYAAQTAANFRVDAGVTGKVTFSLHQESVKEKEVVIQADAILSGEGAMLAERRKSSVIGDGISAEQIRRAPDATTGEALRRVTGLSLVDNKFIFIRGASERYNGATLNGASVSSTEIGRKSFAFDMIPSALLQNTTVIKSMTPDLPGDFTGGLVQMNTLDFPETGMLKVSLSGGANSNTTFRNIERSSGGATDWLGIDDGTRALPEFSTTTELTARMKNTWAPAARKAPANMSASISFGNQYGLGADAESGYLGYIGSFSYRQSAQRSFQAIADLAFARRLEGVIDDVSVLWGGLLNVSWKFGGANKLSVKNTYTHSADDDVRRFGSMDENMQSQYAYTTINWNERSTYSGTLSGEHRLRGLSELQLDWTLSVSNSLRRDPDRKEITYYRPLGAAASDPFDAATNKRAWSHLDNHSKGLQADLTLPVAQAKVKAGVAVDERTSQYEIRFFDIVANFGTPPSLTELPIGTIYAPEHFGPGKFRIDESSKPTDNYDARQRLTAGYAMLDVPFAVFNQNFRLAGGVRLEHSVQSVDVPRTLDGSAPKTHTELDRSDLMPSANLTWIADADVNLRLAYSETVNRPEFREMSSSGFYDFVTYELVAGNPGLQRSYVHNYDIRFEYFPEPGAIVAVSGFYKAISGAIEEQLFQSSVRTRSWFNSDRARNYGVELEVRQSLGFLARELDAVSIAGNYTRIVSAVEFTSVDPSSNSTETRYVRNTRPLQGQSPYMVNCSIHYIAPEWGTALTVLYNRFGKRLDAVGFLTEDLYEMPRDIVDAGITQPIGPMMEVIFTVKNLLDKHRVITRGGNAYSTTDAGVTYGLSYALTF